MLSLNWVKDYIDIDGINPHELADKITRSGINVENVITHNIENLVVGEIIECIDHPNSDHLHICSVDVGTEVLQIVCGASNVKKGLKVIVALPGAILPGDFEIKKGVIRGIESNGMICALFELGLEEKNEETYNKGITELGNDAEVGGNPLSYLGYDDTLIELDVHKHRNNDCYYHIGLAYIIGTIINKPVILPEMTYSEITDNVNNHISLDVKTSRCPYYLGKMVKDVKIKESPDFIKKRLTSAGMRPINNVVDISNYVMLEFGQPMHFFDYDKLGKKVLVRDAIDSEKIITLDGKERILSSKDIVITDGEKPVCIAGVMGGENTEVDKSTSTIFIESAIFDAVSIRNTSNKLNLKSEASIRYGKGLNYEYTKMAMDRACYLLEKYADATVLTDEVLHDDVDKTPKVVKFDYNQVNKMLGINISDVEIAHILKRLDFDYKREDNIFTVVVPNRRLDIEPYVNDIAEEIGRIYGYHNIPETLPVCPTKKGGYSEKLKYIKLISKRLRSLGLTETKSYTLVSSETANLFNYENLEAKTLNSPLSIDKSVIRTNLLGSLLNIYEYNKQRKVSNIMIYEIAKTYDINYNEDIKVGMLLKGDYLANNWQGKGIPVDFFITKGIVENLLDYLGLKNRYSYNKLPINDLHPGISAEILVDREVVGIIGKVHTLISKDDIYVVELSINKLIKEIKPLKFKEATKYPEIKKDMAFIVENSVTAGNMMDEIKRVGGRLLTSINIFDLYSGANMEKDHKSIAFNLTFSDPTRTLSDEEVTVIFNNIIESIKTKFNATLRDK